MNRNQLSRDHFDLLWSIIFHDSDHESFFIFLNRQKLPKSTKINKKWEVSII